MDNPEREEEKIAKEEVLVNQKDTGDSTKRHRRRQRLFIDYGIERILRQSLTDHPCYLFTHTYTQINNNKIRIDWSLKGPQEEGVGGAENWQDRQTKDVFGY